jgi:predicted nucleic acid-binding Zn ribbon protein
MILTKKNSMFSSNEHRLKEIISSLIGQYRLGSKLNEIKITESWEGVVGPMIKKHTLEIKVRNSKLFVKLDSPALKNELSYSRKKLTGLLNNAVGSEVINEIIFT